MKTFNNSLLNSQLIFEKQNKEYLYENENEVMEMMRMGKICGVNELVQKLQLKKRLEEVEDLVNQRDIHHRTGLFYCMYYGYENLILYLVSKGGNPYLYDNQKQNIFHIGLQYGRLSCLKLIINHERHLMKFDLYKTLQMLTSQYEIRKSDIKKGILVSDKRYQKLKQQQFKQFQQHVYHQFEQYLARLVEKFIASMGKTDTFNRNAIHYACFSKFSDCMKSLIYLLDYDLEMDGFDLFKKLHDELQDIEQDQSKRMNVKKYRDIHDQVQNYLTKEQYEQLVLNFRYQINIIRKDLINHQDNEGYTGLHLASFHGDLRITQYLLSRGADKTIQDFQQKSVSDFASSAQIRKCLSDQNSNSQQQDIQAFTNLLNTGLQMDKNANQSQKYNNSQQNSNNVNQSSRSNKQNQKNRSSVISCSGSNKGQMMNQIINSNIDINATDSNGWTALHHVVSQGNQEACQILIKNNADCYKPTNKKYLPIHLAAIHNQSSIVELLVSYEEVKANQLEARANNGITPMILAAKKGNIEVVHKLIELGADIYNQDLFGMTVLHHATINDQCLVISELLKMDADVQKLRNIRNKQGKTAFEVANKQKTQQAFNNLWVSSGMGDTDRIRQQLMIGENINQQTKLHQNTPLIVATLNQQVGAVKFLIQKGADQSLMNVDSKTAKDYAYELNNPILIQLLDSELNDQ